MMDARLSQATGIADLGEALEAAFDVATEVYTTDGLGGCFVIRPPSAARSTRHRRRPDTCFARH
jgi:hypothetical protein